MGVTIMIKKYSQYYSHGGSNYNKKLPNYLIIIDLYSLYIHT